MVNESNLLSTRAVTYIDWLEKVGLNETLDIVLSFKWVGCIGIPDQDLEALIKDRKIIERVLL